MKRSYFSVLLFSVAAACGGDDGDGVNPVVAAPAGDGGVDGPPPIDGPPVCTLSTSDFGDVGEITPTLCIQDPGDDPNTTDDDVIVMRAPLQGGSPYDELEIQLWVGYGALSGGLAAGTYNITGDELRYSTCGVCVFINTDRSDPETYVDDYFATGGSITLDSVNGTLAGSVNGLSFEHVVFADGDSVPVGDGCVTILDGASFSAPLTAPPAKPGAPAARRVKSRGR
jgi:hypothetical protein